MGNTCCFVTHNTTHNTHNTYISLISDLYKTRKKTVHRYSLMTFQKNIKNVYEREEIEPIYISPKIESLISPKKENNIPFLIKGGSAYNSPKDKENIENNIGFILPIDNYIKYESDTSEDDFVVI